MLDRETLANLVGIGRFVARGGPKPRLYASHCSSSMVVSFVITSSIPAPAPALTTTTLRMITSFIMRKNCAREGA